MNPFKRVAVQGETRNLGAIPWNAGGDYGVTLSSSTSAAMRLVPVYSATTLIVDAVTTVPVHAYRDNTNGGKSKIPTQPPVVSAPMVGATPRSTWIGQAMFSLLLRGNAYGLVVERGGAPGYLPTKVVWLDPSVVTVDERGAFPEYSIQGKHIPRHMIVHIPGHCLGGSVVGLSPIGLFRTQVETGLRVDESSHAFYGQATNPRGILMNKSRSLSPDEIDDAKARYHAMREDGDIMVTGSDWAWQSLTLSPADAAFVGAAQMTANQIAAIYHVPPEDIGGVKSGSMTYSTMELNGLQFDKRAVLPWTTRVEAAWSAMLPNPQYVKFNLDAAARVTLKERLEAYQIGLANGIYTLDQVRAWGDDAPLTADEVEFWQSNFRKSAAPALAAPAPVEEGATVNE